MRPSLAGSFALVLATVGVAGAQTTGRITGTILDRSGAPVPAAAITVSGPQLQGTLSATTNSNGLFRFPSLPPGTYRVRADLPGFKTVDRGNVVVGLDRSVELPLTLEVAPTAETITVEAAGPVVDTSSTTTGVNATAELFTRIPVQRDFYGIARVAPGTQDDSIGATFYGSSGAENQYIIEGLNTTGVELGDKGKTLNFDFVQEIEVKSGGLPAEYGRMTGGLINVLTKSGGNEFHGSVFGFGEGGGLASDNETAVDLPNTTTSVLDTDYKRDYGVELGGFLVKDRVWFFGAYNRVDEKQVRTVIRDLTAPGAPPIGSEVPSEVSRNLFAGKLTWRASPNHSLTFSAFGDPTNREGQVFTFLAGPPSTFAGTRKSGSTDLVGRYDGTIGNSFLIRAMVGRHKEKDDFEGDGVTQVQYYDTRVSPNVVTGGFGFFQDQEFTRDVYRLDLTKFAGSHEIKLGGDIEDILALTDNYAAGAGQGIDIFQHAESGTVYYLHSYYVDDRAPGFDEDDPATWRIAVPQTVRPATLNRSLYLQDSWRIAKGFTLNAGVRWEAQKIKDRDGAASIELNDNWAPRVGFVWDPAGNGRGKVYANYGRFFESIPLDINIRSFGGELRCFCYNRDPSPSVIAGDPSLTEVVGPGTRSALLGNHITPVDPNLKGQYVDEFLIGGEYEVASNLALGAKFGYRNLGRVIEDFLVVAEGDYFIANPGEGVGTDVTFYDGVSTAPAPKAERKNYSFELTARKRFADGWQLLASYVWSRLEGNYDGTFQNSSGQLDPNINSAFDYADFTVNAQGRLSMDRTHQLKLDGSYEIRSGALDGLNFGLSTYWQSGLPMNAYGYSFGYGNWEHFLAPRGSLGRGPSDYEANLHVSYPVKLGERARLNLMVDVFNLLDRQAIVLLDERYNLGSDAFCAGIPDALCGDGGGLKNRPGSVEPIGQLADPRATATNPDFLRKGSETSRPQPGNFTLPRSIRIGMRLTF